MITPEKIDEWVHEVDERPASASLIIRFLGNRLTDLTKWNEELQADNIALRNEKKVDEYEDRIANLEYQISILKRQLSTEIELSGDSLSAASPLRTSDKNLSILLYHSQGEVLRLEKPLSSLIPGDRIGHFAGILDHPDLPLRVLAVEDNEELLFAFDSGRTVTMPVTAISAIDPEMLNWQHSFLQPPLGTEELAFIRPVGRMALYEFCLQISRKGCVKKIKEALFETFLRKSYIGTGIKSPPDKTCDLVFARKAERLILVSKEGFLICLDIDTLPTTIEEVLRLGISDHIITAFTITSGEIPDSSLLFITQKGKVIQRYLDWVENTNSYKTKGQAVYSQGRRDTGVRLVYASLTKREDWGITMRSDGNIMIDKVGDLIDSGNILRGEDDVSILDFVTYHIG